MRSRGGIDVECARTGEEKEQAERAVMRFANRSLPINRPQDAHGSDTIRRLADTTVAMLPAVSEWVPRCGFGSIEAEALTTEVTLAVDRCRRQRQLVFDERWMLGRGRHLDHLERVVAGQDAMTDVRWLEDDVAFFHPERIALILIDDLNPPVPDEDDLEGNVVVVHVVGNRSRFWNPNVARNDVSPVPGPG